MRESARRRASCRRALRWTMGLIPVSAAEPPAKLAGPENAAIQLLMRGAGAAAPATPTGLTTGYSSSGGHACSRMSAVDGFTISFLRMWCCTVIRGSA